jgi:hypothetical protein
MKTFFFSFLVILVELCEVVHLYVCIYFAILIQNSFDLSKIDNPMYKSSVTPNYLTGVKCNLKRISDHNFFLNPVSIIYKWYSTLFFRKSSNFAKFKSFEIDSWFMHFWWIISEKLSVPRAEWSHWECVYVHVCFCVCVCVCVCWDWVN